MHEFKFVPVNEFLETCEYLIFFIIAFQLQFFFKKIWYYNILAILAVIFVSGNAAVYQAYVASLVGFLIGVISSWKHPPSTLSVYYFYVVYVVIHPLALVLWTPLLIVETSFPVGILVSLIFWVLINLMVILLDKNFQSFSYYLFFSIPPLILYLFSAILWHSIWIPILITSILTLFIHIFVNLYLF